MAAVGKVNGKPRSDAVIVKRSTGPEADGLCAYRLCRWGDYSGASSDPYSDPRGKHGFVWFTNTWTAGGGTSRDIDWRTVNWGMYPD